MITWMKARLIPSRESSYNKKNTVFKRMFLSNMFLVLAAILITCGVSLYYAVSIKSQDLNITIENLAAYTANMDIVKNDLEKGSPSEEMQHELRLLVNSFHYADILVVCDTNSIRYFHTSSERIGQKFMGNDQTAILKGAVPYVTEGEGTLGTQRRAFHSVKGSNGQVIGFVMASVLTSNIDRVRNQIIYTFLLLLLALIIMGVLLSSATTYRLKKILMGYEPEEFKDLYIEREEVLDSLEEGIFAINSEGIIILMNDSAKRILELPEGERTEGKRLEDVFPETKLTDTLKTGIAEHNINFVIKGKNIISSRIPILSPEQKVIGAVSIFRNKTEVTKLAEELTGAKYMVDTLRAFNHEFMNKLHIILGLLEMNQTEEAKKYILETSLVSGDAVSDISHRVPISTLAALLIGKLIRASELGIKLVLKPDSYFYPKTKKLPVDCYITLIGNLLENAMDELNSADYPVKEIELGIYSEEGHTVISCEDTGGGIPEEILFSIYDSHTTTKGKGHGSGYALIREIVDRYEGTVHIETEKGEGSCIEIILPV